MGIARAKAGCASRLRRQGRCGVPGHRSRAAWRKGIAGLGVLPGSRSGSGLGIPRDGARALQRSHRWNRFLNRIDPPLLRGGRELRLVCTGGGARGPHGFEPLPRPPACQAGAAQLGRVGVGHAGGQHRAGARADGWGREGGRLNGPGASRLPPPGSSAPGCPRPAPEPGSAPAGSACCVRPRPPARHRAQWPINTRSGEWLRCHSFPLKLERWGGTSGRRGVVSGKGRSAGRAVLCIKAWSSAS